MRCAMPLPSKYQTQRSIVCDWHSRDFQDFPAGSSTHMLGSHSAVTWIIVWRATSQGESGAAVLLVYALARVMAVQVYPLTGTWSRLLDDDVAVVVDVGWCGQAAPEHGIRVGRAQSHRCRETCGGQMIGSARRGLKRTSSRLRKASGSGTATSSPAPRVRSPASRRTLAEAWIHLQPAQA
jgi:hypothetical protein